MKILFAGRRHRRDTSIPRSPSPAMCAKRSRTPRSYTSARRAAWRNASCRRRATIFAASRFPGFQRKLSFKNLQKNAKTVAHLVTSTLESKKILRDFKPDLCVGTGGYVSGPVIREAVKLHIPCVIHEQNAYPGVTNKALSRRVDRVMLANGDAQKHMERGARCIVTGNPVRLSVLRADRAAARKRLHLDNRPVILSFGGSLGARKINEAVADPHREHGEDGPIPAHPRLRQVRRMVPGPSFREGRRPLRAPELRHPRVHRRHARLPGRRGPRHLPRGRDYVKRARGRRPARSIIIPEPECRGKTTSTLTQ